MAKQIVSSSLAQPNDIAIDNTGNILLGGYFAIAAIDLDMSASITATFAAMAVEKMPLLPSTTLTAITSGVAPLATQPQMVVGP